MGQTYFDKLTKDQRTNIGIIIKDLRSKSITNTFTQAGVLSVVSKESLFIPKFEKGYQKTANERIRLIFGKYVASYSDDALTKLKADEVAFFNAIYGSRYGNGPLEGWKFRGGGLNQITFKDNYARAAIDTGIDLIAHPERINEVPIAAGALRGYFMRSFKNAPNSILQHYSTIGFNDFKTLDDAVKAIYHANAGWGKSYTALEADTTGGRRKALERASGFLEIVKKTV